MNILFTHFPFIGDESWRAAEASECAAEQDKFHDYEQTIFLNWNGENDGAYSDANLMAFADSVGLNLDQFDDCFNSGKYLSKIKTDQADGLAAGVNSTPTLFLNGVNIGGSRSYPAYQFMLEEALAEVDG